MLDCFAALAGAVADFVFLIRDFEENVHALDS
jgi:ATP-dependent protease HslVU (ClpYQ) peptidase subunit